MNPWWRRPVDRVTFLLGAVIALTVIGQFVAPAPPAQQSTVVVPISALALSCPSLPSDTPGYDVTLKAALRDGTSRARMSLQTRRPVNAVVEAGGVRSLDVRSSAVGLVTASGAAASRLVADASLLGTQTSARGFATYACQPPSASQWLIGGSAISGRSSVLTIANVDEASASVNIEVWTDRGKSGSRSLEGVEIPARSRQQLPLTLIEPGRAIYAIHVVATSGQVSSAIVDRGQRALTSLGVDVIAPAPEPSRVQVVGIIPEGSKSARLAFVSPSIPTTVRVSLLTDDGEFALADAEALSVDADRLTTIDLPDDALVGDVAVILRADDPIAAGAAFTLNIRGGDDLASAPSAAPIYRAASLTIDAGVSKATALLRAERTTQVTVITGFAGRQTRTVATVRAGGITRIPLVGSSGDARLISIEPALDGVVSGSVLIQRASVGMVATSVQPLLSIRGFVAVPPVVPERSR